MRELNYENMKLIDDHKQIIEYGEIEEIETLSPDDQILIAGSNGAYLSFSIFAKALGIDLTDNTSYLKCPKFSGNINDSSNAEKYDVWGIAWNKEEPTVYNNSLLYFKFKEFPDKINLPERLSTVCDDMYNIINFEAYLTVSLYDVPHVEVNQIPLIIKYQCEIYDLDSSSEGTTSLVVLPGFFFYLSGSDLYTGINYDSHFNEYYLLDTDSNNDFLIYFGDKDSTSYESKINLNPLYNRYEDLEANDDYIYTLYLRKASEEIPEEGSILPNPASILHCKNTGDNQLIDFKFTNKSNINKFVANSATDIKYKIVNETSGDIIYVDVIEDYYEINWMDWADAKYDVTLSTVDLNGIYKESISDIYKARTIDDNMSAIMS